MRLPSLILLSMLVVTPVLAQSSASSDSVAIQEAVMKVLQDYMKPFSSAQALDIEAWERSIHFPHYRLSRGKMTIQSAPGEFSLESLRQALGEDWDHSKWQKKHIVHLSESKVHVDTRFARFRKDGSVIASYDSLYVLTKEDGRWGVKMRSTMAH
ncbi:MAG: hypothetical protein ABJN62_19530 [Halioglobus sp.]